MYKLKHIKNFTSSLLNYILIIELKNKGYSSSYISGRYNNRSDYVKNNYPTYCTCPYHH